jgi:hypothetical protein
VTDERPLVDPEWWRKEVSYLGGRRTIYVELRMIIFRPTGSPYTVAAEYHADAPGDTPGWITNHTDLAKARMVLIARGYRRVDTLGPGAVPV